MKNFDMLIIDAQNDFCDPRGSLYVNGADKDSIRLAEFIGKHSALINKIYITLDSHHNYDIAHPLYWEDVKGNHPDPFTVISEEDLQTGKWRTSRPEEREHGNQYVHSLSEKGKYQLCIWPPHCLIGSWGTQIHIDVFNALSKWETENVSMVSKIYKGSNPGTEHYGALEAEIPQYNDPLTTLRTDLVGKLQNSEMLVIAGQALDYCVASTVRQLITVIAEQDIQKLVLLEDCTSSVDPSSGLSNLFLKEVKVKGMKVTESRNFSYIHE